MANSLGYEESWLDWVHSIAKLSHSWPRKPLYGVLLITVPVYLAVVNFVSGCAAGGVGTLTSFPFDVLRTRMLSQGEPKVKCIKEEILSWWRVWNM